MAPTQRLQYVTLDVFTEDLFTGNPLAIVKVPHAVTLSQEQKQAIAKEFNYSETVILHDTADGDNKPEWKTDIFLTTAEIPYAGHPTVGTAVYLGRQLAVSSTSYRGTLLCKAGPVPFRYDPDSQTAVVEVPHDVHIHQKIFEPHEQQIVGLASEVRENIVGNVPFVSLVKGVTFALIELRSEEILAKLKANLKPTKSSKDLDQHWFDNGLVATFFYVRKAPSHDGTTSLRTRMVYESLEDPATGAASATLAAYLTLQDAKRAPFGSERMSYAYEMVQGVEMGRRSVISVEVALTAGKKEILAIGLRGTAVEVMEGSLGI